MEGDQLLLNSSSNGVFIPNWETSVDQIDPFGSALSSIVSSPAGSNAGAGDGFMIRELIGKLGSISDSGEISPQSCITPLNSPPKLNFSSLLEAQLRANFPGLAPLNADPARVSNFDPRNLFGSGGNRFGPELGDSREGSSISEQNPGVELGSKALNHTNSRKRKAKTPVKEEKVEREMEESTNAKRSKPDEEQSAKAAEPQKDYIHVRARRGQATDSHSLAERVRREKISDRMKFLQDLVPGCNKVTGKAVVLDEIINYVQSLQRQVEFLSMKLSTVNPMETLLLPLEYSAPVVPHSYQSQQIPALPNGPLTDGFGDSSSQIPAYWEDDLHSVVQMVFPQGKNSVTPMKVEL